MEEDTARYEQVLRELVSSSADIEGAAIATSDGVLLATNMPQGIDSAFLVELLASAMVLAESFAWDIRKDSLDQLYFKLEHAYVIVMPLIGGMLITLCREQAKLGLIFLDMGRYKPSQTASEGIIIPRPPGRLSGHARPESDDTNE